jgi:toxin secretion/phage lysis holin
MKEYMPTINVPALAVAVVSFMVALLGGWDTPAQALLVFQLVDLFTGIAAAGIQGRLSSDACWKGGVRKLIEWALVAAAVQADNLIPGGHYARTGALLTFCSAELVSLLENAAAAGIRPPAVFGQIVESLRQAPTPPQSLTADPERAGDVRA